MRWELVGWCCDHYRWPVELKVREKMQREGHKTQLSDNSKLQQCVYVCI